MNLSQKSAVANIFCLLFILAYSAGVIYWSGFERFARIYFTDHWAVLLPLYIFSFLRLPILPWPDQKRNTYDEYDRWVAYRAIMIAFSAFWAYTFTVCIAVVIHWHRQPLAPVPVYYLTLALNGGAFLLSLVHAVSVLFLFRREAGAAFENRKT